MATSIENALGAYLKDRRTRLDPAGLGFAGTRRRTPGLRREEVAQRAGISATWYTWLEQGRGGAPSAETLDRIARAMLLTDAEREHLFHLGLGRAPDIAYQPTEGVTPRLQNVLDAFDVSPALIRTATWDVIAWNRAATVILTDYAALQPEERNVLRLMFCNPEVRAAQHDWEAVARFVIAAFRADAVKVGADIDALVEDLSRRSPEFEAMWRDHEVRHHGEGLKQLRHPLLGPIAFEYSAFVVDGRPDLGMVVYNPVNDEDARRIRQLIRSTSVSSSR